MVSIHRILVPVDFSACSRAAIEHAAAFAERFSAVIDVLHVWEVPTYVDPEMMVSVPGTTNQTLFHYAKLRADTDMKEFLQGFGGGLTEGIHGNVAYGDPVDVILEVARDQTYDLIVMGTHGRTRLAHMFVGCVAEKIVRRAPCPVLTIRVPDAPPPKAPSVRPPA